MTTPLDTDKIRRFIEDQFLVEFDESLPEDTDLFREGVMDSFGYVQLHRFLEAEYGLAIPLQEVTAGHLLVSLTQMRAYVTDRLSARGAA